MNKSIDLNALRPETVKTLVNDPGYLQTRTAPVNTPKRHTRKASRASSGRASLVTSDFSAETKKVLDYLKANTSRSKALHRSSIVKGAGVTPAIWKSIKPSLVAAGVRFIGTAGTTRFYFAGAPKATRGRSPKRARATQAAQPSA